MKTNTPLSLTSDLTLRFGDRSDGVIGLPCLTNDGHVVEASYFYGDLKPKNIICVSSQASCPMGCQFCELGAAKFGRSLTPDEMAAQVHMILAESAAAGFDLTRVRHKVTVANSGEPLLNQRIADALADIASVVDCSFKVSTVLPRGPKPRQRLAEIAAFSRRHPHPVQLQLSLISTDEATRVRLSGGGAASFAEVRGAAEDWLSVNPSGRKVNLSLIVTESTPCDVGKVSAAFPAELFRFRFREYVPTKNGAGNGLEPVSRDRLAGIKSEFRERGYDVFDDASPTATERRFSLVANSFRRMYLDMTRSSLSPT